MITPFVLSIAYAFDLLIGDPEHLPHPVRWIGALISSLEDRLYDEDRAEINMILRGGVLVFVVLMIVFLLSLLLHQSLKVLIKMNNITGVVLTGFVLSTLFAVRGLLSSSYGVIQALKEKDTSLARRRLSMIVGRDTDELDERGIMMAVMETLSENISDGFIAPLFYILIGGLEGGFIYKAVNTMDSMIGYRTERYINFGKVAARLDDILNYIPARISAGLIIIAGFIFNLKGGVRYALFMLLHSMKTVLRDGGKHKSPNSGYPEAALAGVLGVRLGGPAIYFGRLFEKPYIGEDLGRDYMSCCYDSMLLIFIVSLSGIVTGILLKGGI
ncbi:MAG: cobalamin biosynthesis protein CobD [Nitrospirae bacterium]|nr:MAG: cobalamin biosynthesis protein CobD [Nitrospirota bacterium]